MGGMEEFLKGFVQMLKGGSDESDWVNVAKLKPEDVLRHKKHDHKMRRVASVINIHITKLNALQAQAQADKAEFWNALYNSYDLPADKVYRISSDGFVKKMIDKKPDND